MSKTVSSILSELNSLSHLQILVVGDIMLDEFHWCNVQRISPEAPVPVCSVKKTTLAPGGAANVAANLAALNVSVDLLGFIGSDSSGEKLRQVLSDHSITTDLLIETDQPTILKSRIIAHQQHVARLDREPGAAYSKEYGEHLLKSIKHTISKYQAIVISDYLKGLLTPEITESIIQYAKKAGCLIVVDPKGPNYDKYTHADFITPNYSEFCLATKNTYDDEATLETAAHRLCNELHLKALIITRSEKGMSIVTDTSFETIPTQAREVFDITGAGDTAIATLAIGLCLDLSPKEAAILANHAAGIVVSKIGTAFVKPDELINTLNS